MPSSASEGKARLGRERSEGKRGRQGEGGGPRTPEGKAISSKNAAKHGLRSPHPFIIQGVESPEEWDEFKFGVIESWQPAGMQELELAINIAFGYWKLRRCRLYENTLITGQVREEEDALFYPDDDEDEDGDEDEDDDEDRSAPEDRPPAEVDPEDLAYHQRLQLIPADLSIDLQLRYEAHVRRTLSSDIHTLEVLQARRRGERTPLTRVEFNSGPSFARRSSAASQVPELGLVRQRVRLAEVALADRRLAARAAKAVRDP
ncbi:MAG: hypothetical protein WEB04_11440 [Dehalococcoidia bacterium]